MNQITIGDSDGLDERLLAQIITQHYRPKGQAVTVTIERHGGKPWLFITHTKGEKTHGTAS